MPNADADRVALKSYGRDLANQLELQHILDGNFCEKLYVFEDFPPQRSAKIPSIHSILWEVLEDRDIWPGSESVPRGPRIIRVILTEAKEPPHSLEFIHVKSSCRILLVLARDLQVVSRSDYKWKEASPGLIQNVLTNIAKFLDSKGASSYLTLHVVRPGTFEQLGRFLSAESYDIVHFDLHGHIRYVESCKNHPWGSHPCLDTYANSYSSERVAKLRFAVQAGNSDPRNDPTLDNNPEYDDQSIQKVADLLQKHRISKVALNSCKSAYPLQSATTNMARILIDHGVTSVCAMSYDIHEDAAGPYYKAFYEAFILGQKDFHDAASFGRQMLRQRFEKQSAVDLPGRTRRECEHLIPVSYRNRVQTMKIGFHRPYISLRKRFVVVLAFILSVLINVAKDISIQGYFDLLQKLIWLSNWGSKVLSLLWVSFLVYRFWGIHTGFYHCFHLAQVYEKMRTSRYTAEYVLSRTDLPVQYRNFRKQQKRRHGGSSDFKFCLGHMDLEENLYRHKCLYVYHSDSSRRKLRSLVRIWIKTGFIDSAVFKDANRFFDLWHRLFWNWTAIYEGKRRPLGQCGPKDERGPRHLIVIENIDHLVKTLHEEVKAENPNRRGRSILLDGGVVRDMDDWISCQGTHGSYILLTGGSEHNRYWWFSLIWAGKIKDRWKVVQPYELRDY